MYVTFYRSRRRRYVATRGYNGTIRVGPADPPNLNDWAQMPRLGVVGLFDRFLGTCCHEAFIHHFKGPEIAQRAGLL